MEPISRAPYICTN